MNMKFILIQELNLLHIPQIIVALQANISIFMLKNLRSIMKFLLINHILVVKIQR